MRSHTRLPEVAAAVWFGAAILGLLGAPTEFINDAAYFAVLPLAAACVLLLSGRLRLRDAVPRSRRKLLGWSLLLTILFFAFLSLTNLLGAPLFSEEGLSAIWWPFRWLRLLYLIWNWTGLLLGYAVSVLLCALFLLERFLEPCPALQLAAPKIRFLGLYRAIWPLALVCLASALSASQSLVVGDATTIWSMARDGNWSEWHTAGYLLFVRLCYLIWPSQKLVVLVQTAAYLYIHNYALSLMERRGMGEAAMRRYCLAAAVVFVPVFFLQVLIKDVAFTLALLAFGLGAMRIAGDAAEGAPRKRDWVWLAVSGLGCCLFRHAGFLPVALTLPVLLAVVAARRGRACWGAVFCGAAIVLSNVLLVNVLAYRVLNFTRNPEYIAYSAPMTMVGAVAASGEDIAPEDLAQMERIMPKEKWAACYDPYFADTLSRPYSLIGADVEKIAQLNWGGELIRLNARFLVQFPKTYLTAFFNLNSLLWEIATPQDGYVRGYLTYPESDVQDLVNALQCQEEGINGNQRTFKQAENTAYTGFAPFVNRYAELLYGTPVLRSLLWRGGFANLCILFAALVLFWKRRKADAIGILPILAVSLGMLLSMPAQEVRYILPNLEYAMLLVCYARHIPAENNRVDVDKQ